MKLLILSVLGSLLTTACLHGGDPCDIKLQADTLGQPALIPLPDIQNPTTGQCEAQFDYSGKGGSTCGDYGGSQGAIPVLDYAICGECAEFGEQECLAQERCRGIYGEENGNLVFSACWGIAPSGPAVGECTELDAYTCSRNNDCIAVHESEDPNLPGGFFRCLPEPTPTVIGGCYGEVLCDALPPACPPNSRREIANGCWTEVCIPVVQCEDEPAGECAVLGEMECIGRGGCVPKYQGSGCGCDGDACTCESWDFRECAQGADLPTPAP